MSAPGPQAAEHGAHDGPGAVFFLLHPAVKGRSPAAYGGNHQQHLHHCLGGGFRMPLNGWKQASVTLPGRA
ncbi:MULTISPECIES: hypothetical protein [unclassified Streptomyces]|uniref:hypothetical protein n=1 Tax=unclassified Streptomyces TaxID=2593676 RepID=UPI00082D8627|nr:MULTISPECIES: hypothetical protein [unclassified Streptomyces]MDN5382402.1 hypothetical protein [Streptomyces sp. LB8]